MPLVQLFARSNLTKKVPLASLQSKLCQIWGTKPNTTKLILVRCEDWTDESFQEDVYVSIRAYGQLQNILLSIAQLLVDDCRLLALVVSFSISYSLFADKLYATSFSQASLNEHASLFWRAYNRFKKHSKITT